MVKCMECATIAPRRLERHVLTDGSVPEVPLSPACGYSTSMKQQRTVRLHPAKCDALRLLIIDFDFGVVLKDRLEIEVRNRQPRVLKRQINEDTIMSRLGRRDLVCGPSRHQNMRDDSMRLK